ncbi:MAG: hypothetical protein WC514_01560 [Candidatus Paceibacterota bacterium]
MKVQITRATKLTPECTPHTICISVKLITETEEDEEIIKSIKELPEERDYLTQVSSYEISCDGKTLEIEISF